MAQKLSEWARTHEKWLVAALFLAFILIRLGGVHLPLHQDEYKWPLATNPAEIGLTTATIPHPPLGEFIYRTAGFIVGFNTNFRFVPLFFGALNLLLLYYLMRCVFGRREAVLASLIWIFAYFSVLASLMVDTDGQIMPFFFLIALIGYYKMNMSSGRSRMWWFVVLILGCLGGFFIKVSFILAIGAIAADYLWSKRRLLSLRQWFTYAGYVVGTVLILAALLYISQRIFSFFDLSAAIMYWEHFAVGFSNRGLFQEAIQCVKVILYASPFLVFVPFLGRKENYSKVGPFIFFLIFAFIFYIVIFDFSLGALDRYLQLIILPLTVFSSVIIVDIFRAKTEEEHHRVKEFFLLGAIVAFVLVLLQFIPHYAPPLQPKSAWIGRVLSLRWNFVYPFSGGSGPLGFYISFLFMGLAWIISAVALMWAKCKPRNLVLVLAFIIPIGIAYNGMFIEEYLVGFINGYAPGLIFPAVQFIQNNSNIKMVTVYNDNGGNEIQATGKYRKRLYISDQFDQKAKMDTLNKYKEDYFVLNVPPIDPTSFYQRYFDSCQVIYNKQDQQMSAKIYDCSHAPDVTNP